MTDEEKQAIERTKSLLKFNLANPFLEHESDDISTILNLIEKQQAEIEVYKDIKELAGIEIREILNWKYENQRLKSEMENLKNRKERQLKRFSKYKENIENKHEEIYEDLVQEIEKKDKIIDKYIAYIWKYDLNESKEWIKNYIENEWEEK